MPSSISFRFFLRCCGNRADGLEKKKKNQNKDEDFIAFPENHFLYDFIYLLCVDKRFINVKK